jgi:toxin FitB
MTTETIPNGSEQRTIIIDSSGWLEYVTDDVNADKFAPYLEGEFEVLIPAIVVYEVYKRLLVAVSRSAAESFAGEAAHRTILPLDGGLALRAAAASIDHHLSMADAIIYATAVTHNVELVTGDEHFRGLAGVVIP